MARSSMMRVGRLPARGSSRRNTTKPPNRMSATAVRMRKMVCTVPAARGSSRANRAAAAAWPARPMKNSHRVLRKACRSCGRTRSSATVATRARSASQARAVKSTFSISEADPAGQHVLPHHPVAGEAQKRVGEGGGAVLFEEKVPGPGERIAGGEAGEEPPEVQARECVQSRGQPQRSADEVQPPAGAVGMLREVARVELPKGHRAHSRPVEERTTGTLTRFQAWTKRVGMALRILIADDHAEIGR